MTSSKGASEYKVEFYNNKKGKFIRVKSTADGGHSADYFHYFSRDGEGNLHEVKINEKVAGELIRRVHDRGPSEGFILQGDPSELQTVNADQILHVKGSKEVSYTATGDKLLYHWPIFEKLRDTNFGSIIRATMTLHQVCSSRCQFCSTINRNRSDTITLEEAKSFVNSLYIEQAEFNKIHFPVYNQKYKDIVGSDIRLRGLILSGGGQPNLWPHFLEFVDWLSQFDIDLGLITNGFPRSVPDRIYQNFKWIRLSITPEDASPFYPDGRFEKQYIPEGIVGNPTLAFGLSYVYGPWTSDDIITRLSQVSSRWDTAYVRFLTDCNLGRTEQLLAHKALAKRLHRLGLVDENGVSVGRIFHQLKYHGTKEEASDLWSDGQCQLQSYNVFWDTTGHERNGVSYLYPCDSVTVLTEEETGTLSQRGFDGEKWGTVTNDHVTKLFNEPLKPFFDPRDICGSCLFMNNNRVVRDLKQLNDYSTILKKVDTPLHLNFP
jgi:hypothetical protein